MADDGMLLNFDLGASSILSTKTAFKGGKWRDRLAAKRSARHRETKIQRGEHPEQKTDRAIFDEQNHKPKGEEYIGSSSQARPAKRQRIGENNKEPEGRNSTTASVISGKLPAGSINVGQSSSTKKRFTDDEPYDSGRNATSAAVISGKLPAGSINPASGGSTVRKFGSDNEDASQDQSTNVLYKTKNLARNGHAPQNRSGAGPGKGANSVPVKPKQIISSLFTFNPSTKTTFEDESQSVEPAKPSNAPLSDEFSTFTNLGMSRRLATHLATKLEMQAPTAIQKAAIPQLIEDDSDAFIQAQTGSGKTLAYLLPIVERIIAITARDDTGEAIPEIQNNNRRIDRKSGLFAIILAPTRELCKQISLVLEKLLRCASWIVGTTVMGGESKSSEKARLRKGVNILIATPGRLADHLDNTEVLNVSTVRWLVMDEGDRLMEMGFEEEIRGIVEKIQRRALVSNADYDHALPSRRVTVLCSATMKMNVQKLGDISLKDAVHIKADTADEEGDQATANNGPNPTINAFSAPAQLQQSYAIVPAKLRLVALQALLKRIFARRGSVMKCIVFLASADSVDFHFKAFSRALSPEISDASAAVSPPAPTDPLTKDTVCACASLSSLSNPLILLHKLHASLSPSPGTNQSLRSATLKSFTASTSPALLFATDLASRGLDVPNIDYILEYDPPFSAADHLHRVGRTARAGRAGRACLFLLPSEVGYVDVLRRASPNLSAATVEDVLSRGFGGLVGKERKDAGVGGSSNGKSDPREWEERATNWQLEVERWVIEKPVALEMARKGFRSHVRAYATHVAAERNVFDIGKIHLGHLAKAFGLREAPGNIGGGIVERGAAVKGKKRLRKRGAGESESESEEEKAPEGEMVRKRKMEMRSRGIRIDGDGGAVDDVARKMRMKMREHMSAASEFNIG